MSESGLIADQMIVSIKTKRSALLYLVILQSLSLRNSLIQTQHPIKIVIPNYPAATEL